MEGNDKKAGINFKLLLNQLTPEFKQSIESGKPFKVNKLSDIFIVSEKGEIMLHNLIDSNVRKNPKVVVNKKPVMILDLFKGFCKSEK